MPDTRPVPLPVRPATAAPDPLARVRRLADALRRRPDPRLLGEYLKLRRALS
ncbi:MAG: hypothetical protein AAGD32_16590 [Planctomycetota bacterium]